MTNLEWALKQNKEEIIETLTTCPPTRWGNCPIMMNSDYTCIECLCKWLKEEHYEPEN